MISRKSASHCIVGRGILTPYFMKTPLHYVPLLFQILSNPPLLHPTSTPTALFVALFLWLNWWSRNIWCYFTYWYYGSTHIEPCYISTRRTLLLVLYNKVSRCWGLTHNVVFCWYSDLIPHRLKNKDTQHTQGPIDWHTHINLNYLLTATMCITFNE